MAMNNKRWLAQAIIGTGGRYIAHAPSLIKDHVDLMPSIRRQIGDGGCALVGFDFPKGIPASFARLAGVTAFKPFLNELGKGEWTDFYNVARVVEEISVYRLSLAN
jgi:hypothetical protein